MALVMNFNIGVLGHVDSGKTSLSIALSSIASTAAFDKNPQSKERGITIDLGFSSFSVDAPTHIQNDGYSKVQYTLVDCPGHASLIRTIIGGAQIIDAMMLVIDINKGIQTQTAECIVLGEIMCKKLIVVLNKIDLVPEEKLRVTSDKIIKRIRNVLNKTKFLDANIVCISANPGGSDELKRNPIGLDKLIEEITAATFIPARNCNAPLAFSVDHCFGIKGQGTIITGTVLQGSMAVNSNIEIPSLKLSKKVKSIQMFRRPVEKAGAGDRIGVCVTQFDPTLLERSLIGNPEDIQITHGFIAKINVISYYKHTIKSKAKFHISLGHDTIMSQVTLFTNQVIQNINEFDFCGEYLYMDEINNAHKDIEADTGWIYALVEFEKAVPALKRSLFIASKLDMDVNTNMCRLAFWGSILLPLVENYKTSIFPLLKVYKEKSKEGIVERMSTQSELIVKNLLKKGTDIDLFTGLKVSLSTGESGVIDGNFGLSGKTKVRITDGLKDETKNILKNISDTRKKGKKSGDDLVVAVEPVNVYLRFKKYIFNSKGRIVQS